MWNFLKPRVAQVMTNEGLAVLQLTMPTRHRPPPIWLLINHTICGDPFSRVMSRKARQWIRKFHDSTEGWHSLLQHCKSQVYYLHDSYIWWRSDPNCKRLGFHHTHHGGLGLLPPSLRTSPSLHASSTSTKHLVDVLNGREPRLDLQLHKELGQHGRSELAAKIDANVYHVGKR
jgi:hypothetical protein